MPFNGSGMFVRVRNWVADAAAGIKIRADFHDIEDDGFADGLSHCIARDGQSVITNNIPMNSKRLVSLADPVNLQDAATKAYADTKVPLTGDSTITGKLTVTGSIAVGSTVKAIGYETRTGYSGTYGGSWFNFSYTGGVLNAWVDSTNLGALATQAFANTAAANAAAPKVNRAGDTMTGGLTVNGEMIAAAGYLRFKYTNSPGYIEWTGGSSYYLGNAGYIWHNGNLNPVLAVRLGTSTDHGPGNESWYELSGAVVTGIYGSGVVSGGNSMLVVVSCRWRWLQYQTPGGWVTVGVG